MANYNTCLLQRSLLREYIRECARRGFVVLFQIVIDALFDLGRDGEALFQLRGGEL